MRLRTAFITATVLTAALCFPEICCGDETVEPALVSAEDVAAADNVQTNLDYVWVLTAAAMVFLMQAGFMCLESGMARAKSSINVAVKNMTDFVLSVSAF